MRENVKQSDWAGLIPTEWEIAPLKSQFLFNKGLPITKADLIEEGLPVISYGQIHSKECIGTSLDERLLRYVDTEYSQSHPSSKTIKGDIIIADTSEDLDGCGNAVLNNKEYPVFAGYHTIILKNVNTNNSKYFAYLLRTDAWRSQIRKQLTEVKLFSITQKTLRQVEVLIPDIEIQNSIVNYLDNACSKIDEAISHHRQIIEKLEEYRKAVITKAVTKGLDPNVEMRDSGISWIGRVPKNWGIGRIKNGYAVTLGKMISSEKSDESQTYENYLCAANIKFSGVDTSVSKQMWYSDKEKKQFLLSEGDLLIMEGGMAGTACRYKGEFSPCYIQNSVHRLKSKEIGKNDFLYYWMNVVFYSGYVTDICNKATILHYTKDKVECTPIVYPSITEQEEISYYLDCLCEKIERATSRHVQMIKSLEEYRKSIIYNAVTGKIDCRDSKS